ncbi:MAG TPA: hypothetical protein VLE44_01460 [Candidatus Saccharimonadales bacterium]|nr:hypothetical protein [Candidatus Saccharimonadales bacterium]
MNRSRFHVLFFIFFVLAGTGLILINISLSKTSIKENITLPSATPFNPFPYKRPTIPSKRSYLTVLVGDSMTEALGVNANQLRLDLISLYPNNEFVNYNYGFGSTNILSVPDRLSIGSVYLGNPYPPILTQGFDLIIIESFAYNPLSQFPVSVGLQKDEETLDSIVKEIIIKHPESIIALMTPIAPNKETFAKGTVNLTPAQRNEWVSERLAYIQKHIDYAKARNLPLINVYEKSLTANGDGDPKYINQTDNIHPSVAGIQLICKTIADFIYQNQFFPY